MVEVVAVGDVNVDVIAHHAAFPVLGKDAFAQSTEFHCGGSAANAAVALAGLGVRTALLSRIGPDPWATIVLQSLGEAGVALSSLQRDPTAMTGLMYIVVTPDGERTILGHRGANALTDPGQVSEDEIQAARLLHLSGYAFLAEPQRSAALRALEIAAYHGLTVTLDPGMSVAQTALGEMRARLPTVDILLPNLAEARTLSGWTRPEDCVQALLDAGAGTVALKLGRDGSLVGTGEGVYSIPGFAIDTRDSTGAGDSFAAGLLAGYLRGLDWYSATLLGNAMGAVAASHVGAGAMVVKAEEALALVRDHRHGPDDCQHSPALERVMELLVAVQERE